MRHDGHFSSPLPCFVRVGWVVSCCFLVGELNFDLFLTSSNNLTATVESNAAIEKKISDGECKPEHSAQVFQQRQGWTPAFLTGEPRHSSGYYTVLTSSYCFSIL